jgi:hypothetical protein
MRFQRPQYVQSMRSYELDQIAEAVMWKMLEAPSGATVTLRVPGSKSPFIALLPGVPRTGDVLWHSVRRNAKPRPFTVARVEWSTGREGQVELFLEVLQVEQRSSAATQLAPHE